MFREVISLANLPFKFPMCAHQESVLPKLTDAHCFCIQWHLVPGGVIPVGNVPWGEHFWRKSQVILVVNCKQLFTAGEMASEQR